MKILKLKTIQFSLLTLLVIGSCAFIQGKYMTVNPGKGISLNVPKTFVKMGDADVIKKFGMHNLPLAVYSDETGLTTLSVNMKSDTIKYRNKVGVRGKDPMMERLFLRASLANTYQKLSFDQDTVLLVNGTPVVRFEFEGTLSGEDAKGKPTMTKSYNFLQYGYVKNRMYIFNFAAPITEKGKWQPIARYAMESVKM